MLKIAGGAKRLSYLLGALFAFATVDVLAISVTYCQPEGTEPVEPVYGYEMGGVLTEEDEITKTPKVAFRGGHS